MTDISSDQIDPSTTGGVRCPVPREHGIAGDAARAVFGQVMGLVALTVGCRGARRLPRARPQRRRRDRGVHRRVRLRLWAQRGLHPRARAAATGLLFGLGLLLGLAVAPVLAAYAKADPSALWQAAGATAAFVAALGSYGYATRRDLSSWARTLFWALLGLIVLGIVLHLRLDPARRTSSMRWPGW